MILSSFMDFLSIALLVPIITLVQKQNIDESPFTKSLIFIEFSNRYQSIIILLVCLIITKGF